MQENWCALPNSFEYKTILVKKLKLMSPFSTFLTHKRAVWRQSDRLHVSSPKFLDGSK